MRNLQLIDRFLGVFLVIFEVRRSGLYTEISDFQNLSVLNDFYALHHFVCHKYTQNVVFRTIFTTL